MIIECLCRRFEMTFISPRRCGWQENSLLPSPSEKKTASQIQKKLPHFIALHVKRTEKLFISFIGFFKGISWCFSSFSSESSKCCVLWNYFNWWGTVFVDYNQNFDSLSAYNFLWLYYGSLHFWGNPVLSKKSWVRVTQDTWNTDPRQTMMISQ